MQSRAIWINGLSRSGKTELLVQKFQDWLKVERSRSGPSPLTGSVLVLAANDENKRTLADKLAMASKGSYPINCKTPLGFITDEVFLFWPLIFGGLKLKPQFPIRLRPEAEQELATNLWREEIKTGYNLMGIGEYRFVRQTLDFLQLAGAAGIPTEEIVETLDRKLSPQDKGRVLALDESDAPYKVGELLIQWRQFCLERGLLSYGIIYELYWRYLLPDNYYKSQLLRRYGALFADDVDDYPAIAHDLFNIFLDESVFSVFTYNLNGQIRLGLNADPDCLGRLSQRCEVISKESDGELSGEIETMLQDEGYIPNLDARFVCLSTVTRAQLLRQTAEAIIKEVKSGVKPEDIVVIAPGLDEISRYTLMEILTRAEIPVQPLNEQRPLVSCPLVRGLLTLLALVTPGLGRLSSADNIAEMLVVLSRHQEDADSGLVALIDPVRAGLIADYCYRSDPDNPHLLSLETFERRDRLGHKATAAYERIFNFIEEIKALKIYPREILEKTSERLLNNGRDLPFDHLAALRELMESLQHFWEVDRRLRQNQLSFRSVTETLSQFIVLLRRGTITANPYPLRQFGHLPQGVTLGNIFQYRSLRQAHEYQFWLDCSSPLWEKGGAATLFGAPCFLRGFSEVWTSELELQQDRVRLQRLLCDLLARAQSRVFLCHSELGVTGTEQTGPLLALIQAVPELAITD
ncbi:MAG: hypothetical protein N5P05_000871 [Chroococcopsis gigantea SAG 12.99]|jgi:hypothetical protein|nr:recombinase family protein [Chlorogloea purpurea SAG 13.99]MDV2999265.1 hypothetical protein [Chroococcopsis gigantea SAG 12.99]